MSRFVRQTAFDVEYAPAKISKWRSPTTGLQLTYINQPSPIVNGYFAVATEIKDDSGCPHTLEHLVFMGSKKYPYKGLLDSLGNRFFSSTNAWTSVDQTVYTLATAGWEGFKTLLPIYLDHLFHPTLTDEACLTEVYHIDGKGKEKGVVYSEMQGIESQGWFLSFMNLQKTLYAADSGYSSETGGLMSELRNLKNSQIRDFHKAMYRPDNLCVVITGSVDESELLTIMSEFDSHLLPLADQAGKRPFVDSPQDLPLSETVIKTVEFPDDDEYMAELVIGWIGPKGSNTLENVAVDMVGSYLTDSPISLFNKHLVEIEDPLATEIDYGTDDYVRTGLNFTVSGIPTAQLEEVDQKLKSLLAELTDPKNIDLKYMTEVVNQQKLKFVAQTERDPASFSNIAISDFIYGNPNGSTLSGWTKNLNDFKALIAWSAEQWSDLIRTYFVDNHSATILSVPSSRLNKEMKKANKVRGKEIKDTYGEKGLQELKQQLEHAQAVNDTPIPDELLTRFGKPDPAKIEFIKTEAFAGGSNDGSFADYHKSGKLFDNIKNDQPENFPLYLHFENYHSQFAVAHLLMSTTTVPPKLLRYFSVFEEIFNMSIQLPSGEYLPYESVITELNNDLIEYQFDNGIENQFAELSSVKIKFENSNYKKSIEWLVNVLKYSVFEESRIRVIVEKIVNSLADKKRNDELMMYSLQYRTVYSDASLRKAQDCINTEEFYKDVLEQIKDGNFESIKKDLESVRDHLFNASNMKVFVVGGVSGLENPVSSWQSFVHEFENQPDASSLKLTEIPRAYQFKTPLGKECSKKAFLAITPASETTHFMSLTPIPTEYLNEDIYKIALASEFLGGVEGPFWRAIRGTGLAYGANIRRLIESGYLSFSIYRGADAQQAWVTGKQIISDYVTGELEIDEISIENSIAAIVNELANAQANSYDAAINRITDTIFKKRGQDYVSHFLGKLNTYTSKDMIYIMRKYFLPLFDSQTSLIFSCVPTTKGDAFSTFLSSQGYDVSVETVNAVADDDQEEIGSSGDESGSTDESESGSDDSDSQDDSETESETDEE